MGEFVFASRLAAEPEAVWRHAVAPSLLNREFTPFLRMTFPAGVDDVTAASPRGERSFRSWLLAFGIVPVDYDDVVFAEVERGRRFLETSTLLSQRVWQHERTIEPAGEGCRVTDRVRFVPRIGLLAAVYGAVFRAVFRWRHRRLRSLFGGEPA